VAIDPTVAIERPYLKNKISQSRIHYIVLRKIIIVSTTKNGLEETWSKKRKSLGLFTYVKQYKARKRFMEQHKKQRQRQMTSKEQIRCMIVFTSSFLIIKFIHVYMDGF
jgi:hypothetical protein